MLKAPLINLLVRHVLPDDGETLLANTDANGGFTPLALTDANNSFGAADSDSVSDSIAAFPPLLGAEQAPAVTIDQTAPAMTPILQVQQTSALALDNGGTSEITSASLIKPGIFEGTTGVRSR